MPSRSGSPKIEAFAPAKVNLTLHVTGQRADGYHVLDSLVAFADMGDRLWLEPSPALSLAVEGPFADGVPCDERNLVWRAAVLAGWTGHIRLEKNLPHGGGIGGGSADAAALLRALGTKEDGLSLGADIPVCRLGRAALMGGVGEVLRPIDLPAPLYGVLVNPMCHVPTPAVFKALEQKENPPMAPMPQQASDFWSWLADQRNDLERPAVTAAPIIAEALQALSQHGASVVRMSGSGSTCFALFEGAGPHVAAAQRIARDHPDWWVKPVMLS